MGERCPGSVEYVGFNTPRVGLRRGICPCCGRPIMFHWATGRFARHNIDRVIAVADRSEDE